MERDSLKKIKELDEKAQKAGGLSQTEGFCRFS